MVQNEHINDGPPRLDDQYEAHRRRVAGANQRTAKMLAAIILPLLGLVYVVARMIIWRSATDSYARFLARSLDSASWSLAQEGLILLNQVRVAALDTLFVRFVLPFCLLFIVVFIAAAYALRRVPTLLYMKPGLVRHLLMVDAAALATHSAFVRSTRWVLLVLAALCVAGAFLLPSQLVPGFLLASLLLMCLTVFVLGFRWIRQADRLGAARQKVSPAYVRAACVSGAIRQCVLLLSILILVVGAATLARSTAAVLARSNGSEWLSQLERWEIRLSAHRVEEANSVLLADARNEVRSTIDRLASAKFEILEALGPSGIRSLAAVLLFIACAVACLDVGVTLARLEYREPALALGLGVLAAFVLSFVEVGIKESFPHGAAFSFAAGYGVLLLTFVLGQLSAFIIRLYTQPGTECPVCLNRSENPVKCSVCGLRFDRSRETEYVGNKTSGELHVRQCAHASKIGRESCNTFTSLEQALWAGYDLCGSCLGGSQSALGKTTSKAD